MLPGGFPGDLMARGRGGFPRGGRGGPPAGFPPRGLAPPFIGGRGGGRGGRGGRGGPPGAYGRPRGEEPCFNIGGEEGKGEDGEGEGAELSFYVLVVAPVLKEKEGGIKQPGILTINPQGQK